MAMLFSREKLKFDFKGAQFDVNSQQERELLVWIFNQFLYGEITGIQCGYWLYRAPTLNAALFLARQAQEELSHVKRIYRILTLLDAKPVPAHWAVKFLSTGMMGGSWAAHVALEMAMGEGLALHAFYALEDCLPEGELRKILSTLVIEEERHVEFGELETQKCLEKNPFLARGLKAELALQRFILNGFKMQMTKILVKQGLQAHPVLSQFDLFFEHTLRAWDERIVRLGISADPKGELSGVSGILMILTLPIRALKNRLTLKAPLLTHTYLRDDSLTILPP